jgi:hypothetical protein
MILYVILYFFYFILLFGFFEFEYVKIIRKNNDIKNKDKIVKIK